METSQKRLDDFIATNGKSLRSKTRKYSTKMETLIMEGFHNAPKGELRLKTGKALHKDFEKLFSPTLMKTITPKAIVKKYYNLQNDAKAFEDGTGIYKDNTLLVKTISVKSAPATIKELMLSAMQKSENMTINVQGENITVTFK